jgi:hypothetical protein
MGPQPESPAWRQLVVELAGIARHHNEAIAQLHQLSAITPDWHDRVKDFQRKYHTRLDPATGAPQLPDTTSMQQAAWRAAERYVVERQKEQCPAKGSYSHDEVLLPLLRQGRDILHGALGIEAFVQAHRENIPRREKIVLEEPLGDLEEAAGEAGLDHRIFRVGRERCKAWLFRRVMPAQAKALRDRREGGEWWFPYGTFVRVEGVAMQASLGASVVETGATVAVEGFDMRLSLEESTVEVTGSPIETLVTLVEAEQPSSPGEMPAAGNPALTRRGRRSSKQKTESSKSWSELLTGRITELTALLMPDPATNLDEAAFVLGTSRRRLSALGELDPDHEHRRKAERELMDPKLVAAIRAHRIHHPKSGPNHS